MAAVNYDLDIEQGATFSRLFIWKDAQGAPIDLMGCSARMQVRPSVSSELVLLDLSLGNGLTLGGVTGEIELEISAQQTAAMKRGGVFDLEIVNGETVTRLIQGVIRLSKEVTRHG